MSLRRERHPDMNLNELDYSITYQLCQNFDIDRSWEPLAGVIGYATSHIQIFELETRRPDGSPTKKLLWDWGTRGGTVRQLYNKLALINKTHSMRLLEHIMNLDQQAQEKDKEQTEKDMRECEKKEENERKKSNNLQYMPGSETMNYNPNSLPIPSLKKCSSSSASITDNASVDVNINTPDFKSEKSSDKLFNKVLGVVPDQGASSVEMHECHADGPPSTKGNMGAASSPMISSFERARSVVEYGSQTSSMSQLNKDEKEIARALMGTPHYTYKELSQATDGFNAAKYKLGQGKFGSVYMAIVKHTKCAIKKLTQKHERNDEESSSSHLATELKSLSRYRHENIVILYGYALDGDEVCLVYQYMPNGSLDDCLHCKNGHDVVLTWEQRLFILCGAACGLQFLHSVDDKPVIHGDIKSANILLDRHFEAKIGDLGLAQQATGGDDGGKLTHITKKNTCTHDYKNKAYHAPEILRGNGFSIKGDTYAFGVVIFECLTGLEPYVEDRKDEKYLIGYIEDMVHENPKMNKQKDLEDSKLDRSYPTTMFVQLFDLAERCVRDKKRDRPTMVEVYTELAKIEIDYQGEEYKNIQEVDVNKKADKKLKDSSTGISSRLSFNSDVGHKPSPSPHPPQTLPFSKVYHGKSQPSPIDYLPKDQPLPPPFRHQLEWDKRQDHSYENVEQFKKEDCFDSDPKKMAEIEKSEKYFKSGNYSDKTSDLENGFPKSDPKKEKVIDEFDKKNIDGKGKKLEDVEPGDVNMIYASDPKKVAILEMREEQEEVVKHTSSMESHVYENVPAKQAHESEDLHVNNGVLAPTRQATEMDSDVDDDTQEDRQAGFDLDNEYAEITDKACKGDSSMMDIFNRFECLKEGENLYEYDPELVNTGYDDFDFNIHFDFENEDSETSTITDSLNNDFGDLNISEIDDNDLFAHECQVSYGSGPITAEKKLDASLQDHQERLAKYQGMTDIASNCEQTVKCSQRQENKQCCETDGNYVVQNQGQSSQGFHGDTCDYGNQGHIAEQNHVVDPSQGQAKPGFQGNQFKVREPTEGECYV